MEIPIGKYVITSDSYCYALSEKKKVKEGENQGTEYLQNIGYYSTIEICLEALLEHKIRTSDAATIKELLEEMKKASKFIRAEFKKAKGGVDKL